MAKQPYRMTKLSEIRPYDRNPRIIPQAAVDAVARSIQAFGFRAPIVVDAAGVILAGHTRYKAAQQLGLEVVPVVWQSDITDIQARGYRIADNKVAEIATWDRDALDDEVRELAEIADADLDALGLASWELERIMADATPEAAPEPAIQTAGSFSQGGNPSPVLSTSGMTTPAAGPSGCGQLPKMNDLFITICYNSAESEQLARLLCIPADALAKRKYYTVDELAKAQGGER